MDQAWKKIHHLQPRGQPDLQLLLRQNAGLLYRNEWQVRKDYSSYWQLFIKKSVSGGTMSRLILKHILQLTTADYSHVICDPFMIGDTFQADRNIREPGGQITLHLGIEGVFHPRISAVDVFRVHMQHGGISPTSSPFHRDNLVNRGAAELQPVRLEGPGTGSGNTFVGKLIHLNE